MGVDRGRWSGFCEGAGQDWCLQSRITQGGSLGTQSSVVPTLRCPRTDPCMSAAHTHSVHTCTHTHTHHSLVGTMGARRGRTCLTDLVCVRLAPSLAIPHQAPADTALGAVLATGQQ